MGIFILPTVHNVSHAFKQDSIRLFDICESG